MTTGFNNLGLSDSRLQHLETLGFTTPTEIQTKAIPLLLEGHDMVGMSQTGTGKTAAYSLPLLERMDTKNPNVQALILTPTRELAQQVASAIKDFSDDRRLFILTVCGGQSMERQIRSLEKGVQIVVGTPGRVIDLLDRKKLHLESLNWVVLDEADEMLSMGFIDDVKKILQASPSTRQTACFSATMPREIRDLIANFLKSPVSVTVSQPQAAPAKIEQKIYLIPRGWTKLKVLQPLLEIEPLESAIIFVRTKQTAAELTSKLQEAGQTVDEYHGNLSQVQRERLVQRFREGKIKLVVATDIAARGLDVENLSHVINYDLPDNAETYIHRIGRTGRAGKTGTAISLVEPIDRRLLRQIEQRLRQRLESSPIPSRAEVEAKRLAKLQNQLKEALSGERMASFLPLVRDLSEEYDPQAIAAAALQMIYDQNCPQWMKTDWEVPAPTSSKPVINKTPRSGGNKYPSKSNNRPSLDKKIVFQER
ncbi:DEAD-box ATP-dependent RNA helicase CshA [Microcystis aeruginosa NIES-2549]|jgi:ATP-dependent RNA helicase DeaD|uniref:RNA helicase n=2 Tax=Microcystis TaxID=1125 RepID=A0A0F6RMI6_MICAE|nr:DEAD/DEAH box helicase [Microcystis aeruginosa]AKE65610.1 DEAD-box ATP-dependent RNA helicase CshA [Microcystis aeruginosa NIES-2549]